MVCSSWISRKCVFDFFISVMCLLCRLVKVLIGEFFVMIIVLVVGLVGVCV